MRSRTVLFRVLGLLVSILSSSSAGAWTHDIFQNDEIAANDNMYGFPNTVLADGAGGFYYLRLDDPAMDRLTVTHLDRDGRVDWAQPTAVTASGWGLFDSYDATVSGGALYVAVAAGGNAEPVAVWLQKVAVDGSLPWGGEARRATVGLTTAAQTAPSIVPDGQGGVILVWQDERNGAADVDIYGQRFDAAGNYYWTNTGLTIDDRLGNQVEPRVVPATDGVLLAWHDVSFARSVLLANKLDLTGTFLWDANWLVVDGGVALNQWSVAADGHDGLFVAWTHDEGSKDTAWVGQVDAPGNVTTVPVTVSQAESQYVEKVAADGHGGCYVLWRDARADDPYSYDVLYAQHLPGLNTPIWGRGVVVAPIDALQYVMDAAVDTFGRLVVYFKDYRYPSLPYPFVQVLAPQTGSRGFTAQGQPVSLAGDGMTVDGNLAMDDRGGLVLAFRSMASTSLYRDLVQRIDATGYPGDPAPALAVVADVPQDQGGAVLLTWEGSWLDAFGEDGLSRYSVWNRSAGTGKAAGVVDARTAAAVAEASGLPAGEVRSMLAAGWTYVGDQPAQQFPTYGYTAPTFGDSTGNGTPLTEFQVTALGNAGEVWHSNVLAGYSVDNLAPGAPLALSGALQGVDVYLDWTPSGVNDKDLQEYRVYRSATPGVPVDPAHRVGTATDTTLVDPAPPSGPQYYVVTAVDVHGNESDPSNEVIVNSVTAVGDAPPRVLVLADARPNPFNPRTEIRLGLPATGQVRVTVYDMRGGVVRRLAAGRRSAGWHVVTWDGTDVAGRAVPSGTYLVRARSGAAVASVKVLLAR